MPKRRLPPIRSRKQKKEKQVPETADDFISIGVELEESGDRWRPGDKPKAGRFYVRAIASYEEALQRNPQSFDASYNRARLQYQLGQDPSLLPDTPGTSPKPLLEVAAQSHRECIRLEPENEDALFNAGQVLCSLAETLVEYKTAPAEARNEAVRLLCEALDMFQRCLAIQETQYMATGEGGARGSTETTMVDLDSHTVQDGGDEQMIDASGSDNARWAIVRTPVTPSQILDTTLAQLEACAVLLQLCADGHAEKPLSWVQSTAQTLVESKITPLSIETGRESEVALAKANFEVSLGEAGFKAGSTNLSGWETVILSVFPNSSLGDAGFRELCDKADAHIQLASAAVDSSGDSVELNMGWKHYAFAAKSLSAAAKLQPGKSRIHIARGDVEMMRAKLGIPAAVESRDVLLRNAGVFYHGAKRLEGDEGDKRVVAEAAIKEAMVAYEGGDEGELLKKVQMGDIGRGVVVDAVDEGVFGSEWLERMDCQGV